MRRQFLKGLMAAVAVPSALRAQGLSDTVQLRMASFNVGSSWYVYAVAIADAVKKAFPEGTGFEVLAYQGGIGNPHIVHNGDADLALSFAALSNWAHAGRLGFAEPMTDLRGLVGNLAAPHRLAIVARRDARVGSLAEIAEGRPVRLVTTARGSAGELLARLALEAYGLDYAAVEAAGGRVTHIDLPVAIQQMRDGQADLLIHNVGFKHPAVLELSLGGAVDFLEMGAEQRAFIAETYGLSDGLSIDAGEYEGVDSAIASVGYPTSVIVSKRMSVDVAYALTRAICEGAETLRSAHPGLAEFDPARAASTAGNGGLQLHPGAERYYREAGLL
ncbi:TAXI family TRAP transporter solute-binding subunit [Sedimentitalea sp. XS_ASV28]|uniref:TAXI family TRAP transporter solute-binding subunit n=1 Tax=Sedimentitalea sp. XS_ASV28 TaxID=3241296 RepID=UPI003518BEC3